MSCLEKFLLISRGNALKHQKALRIFPLTPVGMYCFFTSRFDPPTTSMVSVRKECLFRRRERTRKAELQLSFH